ncbi:MAG: hypothetical protein Q9218_004364 [Villophora microphyllina]
MVQSSILLALAGLVAYISARPSPETKTPASISFEGIATFNDYSYQLQTQGSTVCGGKSIPALNSGTFGAAAGDLSPLFTQNGGQAPDPKHYSGPACKYAKCSPATCYTVENIGPVGGVTGQVLGSTKVQIIDGCPAGSAWNYCKSQVDPTQRCSSPTTEALDIDYTAYSTLYPGKQYSSGNPEGNANLQIRITPTSC